MFSPLQHSQEGMDKTTEIIYHLAFFFLNEAMYKTLHLCPQMATVQKNCKACWKTKGKQISLPMSSCNISVFPVDNVLLVLLVCSITTDLCTSVSILLLLNFAQC